MLKQNTSSFAVARSHEKSICALDAKMYWTGRTLTVEIAPLTEPMILELRIDGVRFDTQALSVGESVKCAFTFAFMPGGRTLIAFELLLQPGGYALLPAPWIVSYGESASFSEAEPTIELSRPLLPLFWSGIVTSLAGKDALILPVTIIVPVYNAKKSLEYCIRSLITHTTGIARLILIDDASTDPAIAPLLAQYAPIPNITILRNDGNLGYTRTINRGIVAAGATDVVLLNADTEVGPNWLQGLRRAAYSQVDIGTATAVSDNAGAFSVPELEEHNPLPQQWDFVQTTRVCWQQAGLIYPRLPTGNGFCMYIKQAVLAQIGLFDEQAFPQGYGEENDFCMRAAAVGYQHVIAGNVLVRHARSQSFGHERRLALGQTGMAVLRERYPDYEALVGARLFSFERQVLNWRIRRSWCDADGIYATQLPRPRVLFVQNAGAKLLLDPEPGLCKEFELWRVRATQDSLLLETYALEWRVEQQQTIGLPSKNSVSANDELVLCAWLQHYAIELICLDEAVEVLQRLARTLEIPCCIESDFLSAPMLVNHLQQAVIAARSFVK